MINDEKIISALLSTKTVRQAAELCGIGETSLYARLKNDDFKAKFAAARMEILELTKNRLQGEMAASVDVLCSIRDDTEERSQIRVNAADAILRHGYRMIELFDMHERIKKLEKALEDGDFNAV